jgi:hypothetical protein
MTDKKILGERDWGDGKVGQNIDRSPDGKPSAAVGTTIQSQGGFPTIMAPAGEGEKSKPLALHEVLLDVVLFGSTSNYNPGKWMKDEICGDRGGIRMIPTHWIWGALGARLIERMRRGVKIEKLEALLAQGPEAVTSHARRDLEMVKLAMAEVESGMTKAQVNAAVNAAEQKLAGGIPGDVRAYMEATTGAEKRSAAWSVAKKLNPLGLFGVGVVAKLFAGALMTLVGATAVYKVGFEFAEMSEMSRSNKISNVACILAELTIGLLVIRGVTRRFKSWGGAGLFTEPGRVAELSAEIKNIKNFVKGVEDGRAIPEVIEEVNSSVTEVIKLAVGRAQLGPALDEIRLILANSEELRAIPRVEQKLGQEIKKVWEHIMGSADIEAAGARRFIEMSEEYPILSKMAELNREKFDSLMTKLVEAMRLFETKAGTEVYKYIKKLSGELQASIRRIVSESESVLAADYTASSVPRFAQLSDEVGASVNGLRTAPGDFNAAIEEVIIGTERIGAPAGLLEFEKNLKAVAPGFRGDGFALSPASESLTGLASTSSVRRNFIEHAQQLERQSRTIVIDVKGRSPEAEATLKNILNRRDYRDSLHDLRKYASEAGIWRAPALAAPMAIPSWQGSGGEFRGTGVTDTWEEGRTINDLIVSKNILSKLTKGNKIMNLNKKDLKKLVKEVLNEGQVPSSWPYQESGSETGERDMAMEFSELVKGLSADPGVDHSIGLAKIFVKDNDLFSILLDLVKNGDNAEVMEKIVKAHRQQEDGKQST